MIRKKFLLILIVLLCVTLITGCGDSNQSATVNTPGTTLDSQTSEVTKLSGPKEVYLDSRANIEDRVNDLLSRMNLDEKIGQMVQPEASFINPYDIKKYYIGSVLSGGGHAPGNGTFSAWAKMIAEYQKSAFSTRLGIPIIYGVDAVHGMAKYLDVVVFPHNSALGAANDMILMEKIGQYTAKEMKLCGVTWNFAPCVAVAKDIRWGRTYESYSENPYRVSALSARYIIGLNNNGVIATAKHFFGDGGTLWGTGDSGYFIDQGNLIELDTQKLKEFLSPYEMAIKSGTRSVMVSLHCQNCVKMHENTEWIQNWLKDEMEFTGFVVSDWNAIQQIKAKNYHEQVVKGVNAGIDMLMEVDSWRDTLKELKEAVNNGEISINRIDDAVKRILRVKFENQLFENPLLKAENADTVLIEAGIVAREAVSKSLVLLKNENQVLPLKQSSNLVVIGNAANDMAMHCGGWTMNWQGLKVGSKMEIVAGKTILDAFKSCAEENGVNIYTSMDDASKADAVILVLGELPHAEGPGDDPSLNLSEYLADPDNIATIDKAKASGLPVITIMISGRPRIITEDINDWDAFVMAWLPGSEGEGVTDVLYGDSDFTGTLQFSWPKSIKYIEKNAQGLSNEDEILYPYGYGLNYASK